MFYSIVMISGDIVEQIDVKGRPNKYGEPILFLNKRLAELWIKRRTYKGMSFRYEIREVTI